MADGVPPPAADAAEPGAVPAESVSPRTSWIAGALLAAAAAGVHALRNPGEVFGGMSDEALLVPLARRVAFGDTFGADVWLERAGEVFSVVYSWVLAPLLRLFDDPVVATRALALPCHAAFLAGSFRVAERAAGRRAAWTAAVALTLLPPILAWAEGRHGGTPFAAGSALPRDLVFAALPWIWVLHETLPLELPLRRVVLFFAVGLLANLHALTAVHVAGILAIDLVLRWRTAAALVDAAAGLAAVAAGALPFIVQYARYPRTPGAVPDEVLRWRVEGIGAPSLVSWADAVQTPLWLLLAWIVASRAGRGGATAGLSRLALVSFAVAALAPAADGVVRGIQTDRLARVAVWAAVPLLADAVPAAIRARRFVLVAVSAALVGVAVLGAPAVEALRGARRGPLLHLARVVDGRPLDDEAPLQARRHPGDPSRGAGRAAAFAEICAAAREASGADALFLVPPERFGAFRAYAGRGVHVTRKEGGFALSFLGGRGAEWFEQYAAAIAAWADPDPGARAALARKAGASFAVLDTDVVAPVGWREIRRAGPYRLFRIDVP